MIKIIFKKSLAILAISSVFVFCDKNEIGFSPDSIITNPITFITSTTATTGIIINNSSGLNITFAGLVYSTTNISPTINDSVLNVNKSGNLSGFYTLGLTKLISNTTYFIRGYINYNNTITYGEGKSFTTGLPPQSVLDLAANMVTIPSGTFTMGCTPKQLQNKGVCTAGTPSTQQVTLSSYKICKHEVTQQLWLDIMGNNPSRYAGNLQRPVEQVSWDSCQIFITKLNQLTGKSYRLPTEAEWEYAARGANNNDSYFYSGSDNLDSVAWYGGDGAVGGDSTQIVGTKKANQLGLYDMSGNVNEWCRDNWPSSYSNTPVINPVGAGIGEFRVYRGGSYATNFIFLRVSFRDYYTPTDPYYFVGLRLVSNP